VKEWLGLLEDEGVLYVRLKGSYKQHESESQQQSTVLKKELLPHLMLVYFRNLWQLESKTR